LILCLFSTNTKLQKKRMEQNRCTNRERSESEKYKKKFGEGDIKSIINRSTMTKSKVGKMK